MELLSTPYGKNKLTELQSIMHPKPLLAITGQSSAFNAQNRVVPLHTEIIQYLRFISDEFESLVGTRGKGFLTSEISGHVGNSRS